MPCGSTLLHELAQAAAIRAEAAFFSNPCCLDPPPFRPPVTPHGWLQRGRLRGAVQVALRQNFAYHSIRRLVNRPSGGRSRKCAIYLVHSAGAGFRARVRRGCGKVHGIKLINLASMSPRNPMNVLLQSEGSILVADLRRHVHEVMASAQPDRGVGMPGRTCSSILAASKTP